jgi:hypothetical protein
MGMGEFKILFDDGARLGRWTTLGGAAWVAGDGVFPNRMGLPDEDFV